MKNLKISQKLLVGFGTVILLTVIFAGFSIFTTVSIDNDYTHLLDHNIENVVTLYGIDGQFWQARRALSHMGVFAGLEGAEGNINAQLNAIKQIVDDIGKKLDNYVELVKTDKNFTAAEKDDKIAMANRIKELSAIWYSQVVLPVTQANLDGRRQDVIDISLSVAGISNELFSTVTDLVSSAEDTTNDISTAATRSTIILGVLAVIVVLISVAFALVLPNSIVKPLAVFTAFMQRAGATGDIAIQPEDAETIEHYSQFRDEVGKCISSYSSFINHIIKISENLEAVANSDLTIDIDLLSDMDIMGQSLKHMVDNLNQMFQNINTSTAQVSSGSQQVATGAQTLAQGSTEQAASISELSDSVADIADKTKANHETAEQAAKLAEVIISNAEKGSRQMDEMIKAVQDIDQASHNISKVIKVIDDIAFQTNILALNAAVEAARAGEHGKGFAVVAEEVRNLASKSAEAAKETGTMIENSMEKAEFGSRIAGETAESLTEIVNGINESSRLIRSIAQASEEQSTGIEQVNVGIDQVAQVVHQNSATAEESAAASEEMSSQSVLLHDLIAQFKLKN
ncbi:MAG: methyl-accepting chemotaxis protein [Clostridiales bacterium]|nr:methyl-accepting chemotaxis protein [Clostridiales bacterium]